MYAVLTQKFSKSRRKTNIRKSKPKWPRTSAPIPSEPSTSNTSALQEPSDRNLSLILSPEFLNARSESVHARNKAPVYSLVIVFFEGFFASYLHLCFGGVWDNYIPLTQENTMQRVSKPNLSDPPSKGHPCRPLFKDSSPFRALFGSES